MVLEGSAEFLLGRGCACQQFAAERFGDSPGPETGDVRDATKSLALCLGQDVHGDRVSQDLTGGVSISVLQSVVGHLGEEVLLGRVDGRGELRRGKAQPDTGQGHAR
jgi:hypothetical protein